MDFGRHDLIGGRAQALDVGIAIIARQGEAEAFERADEMAFQPHFATFIDLGRCHTFVFQMTQQDAGAPVDEPLGEPLVQRVTQAILNVSGLFAPM
ncbi:hypothetical protein D3C87_1686640 [compost metagenome]